MKLSNFTSCSDFCMKRELANTFKTELYTVADCMYMVTPGKLSHSLSGLLADDCLAWKEFELFEDKILSDVTNS